MDESTDHSFEFQKIKIGDIVKFFRYDYDAYAKVVYGVVVSKGTSTQIYLFPSVDVFIFNTHQVETIAVSAVKIISHA
tara:strand:- start:199 stop:432 length:234 start_codon:yes stop_codon:yes gene_type:complete